MPELNVPLLRKAVEWVEAQDRLPVDDRQWMQGLWIVPESDRVELNMGGQGCGTAYCVAGYVGALADARYTDNPWGNDNLGPHVSEIAQDALGLTNRQADLLFQASNTAGDIRQLAEKFAGENL